MTFERVSDFYQTQYTAKFINYLPQTWKDGRVWDCIGSPKAEHLFLLFVRGGAVYTDKNGQTLRIEEGELMYTPKGSEYSVRFFGTDEGSAETLAVRFSLLDERGEDIVMPCDTFRFPKSEIVPILFHEISQLAFDVPQIPVKYDCVLYTLITELGALDGLETATRNQFKSIQKGLEYLTRHFNENVSVEELARLCHISAVYFRKLFKAYMGASPVEYRTELRLIRAREYLLYGEDPVNEIAEKLGYFSPAYFIKQFKEKYRCSPYAYRLKYKR